MHQRADPLTVVWQSSDLRYLEPTLLAEPGPGVIGDWALSTSRSNASSTPVTLSSGVKAGIGVGFAAAAVLSLAVALLWWRRYRKSKIGTKDVAVNVAGKPEVSSEDLHRELPDEGAIHEVHDMSKPPEIDGVSRTELATSDT